MSARDVELWVSKDAPVADVMEWAVLTVYAEQADDDGCNACRSHKTIAAITRMSVDCVKDVVRRLKERRILVRGDQSAALRYDPSVRPVVYDIMIPYSWFGSRLERINRTRADRGRPPLIPEDRPELPPIPEKRRRPDAGIPRAEYRRRKAEEAAGQSGEGGGATSTSADSSGMPQGDEAPGCSDRSDGGASSPTTKPLSTDNNNQEQTLLSSQATPTHDDASNVVSIDSGKTDATKRDTSRGTRLPAGWAPSDGLSDWTRRECPAVRRPELDRFRDYWIAQPGVKGRKTDWDATWRNWCRDVQKRTDADTLRAARGPVARQQAEQDHTNRIFDDAMTRARARDAAEAAAATQGVRHG